MTTFWIPEENKDHKVELDEITGNPIRVVKGHKSIQQLVKEMNDANAVKDPNVGNDSKTENKIKNLQDSVGDLYDIVEDGKVTPVEKSSFTNRIKKFFRK